MDFKRFNGTAWETVRHKIYGSGTEQLASFPAMIQASGEPLTDYTIYGNTVQNGTPTPDAPVDVVGCGVWDATAQQYKIPITVNGTEHPIYLGQVETTRRIKKLVLNGSEDIYVISDGVLYFTPQDTMIKQSRLYCTHYAYYNLPRDEIPVNSVTTRGGAGTSLWFKTEYATAADFKSYLAAQYAAGTPVTVWYVLAEPETGIANEPLMKIGDYADTISMAQAEVTIPTSDGGNTITFGTSVQPSAMSATFKGWHAVQAAKQYDGSEWR